MTDVVLRRATSADVEALAQAVVDGVADYPAFAPPGWVAPSAADEADHLRELLPDERVSCIVAETAAGELAGQVTVLPASIAARPVDEPALAHLRNLFVRRDLWGAGVARTLNAAAADAARQRGFAEMRLFVAAGQSRARRFYEREGWAPAGEPFHDPTPGLDLVEYRLPLTPRRSGRRSG